MRDKEREGEMGRGANVHLGKTAADMEPASVQEERVVGMRPARDDRQTAEHGDMDVRVPAADEFPLRVIRSFGFERIAEFQQGAEAADFFEGDDVGVQRADAFADFGPGGGGFDRARFPGLVEIIFDVIGGDAECAGAQAGREQGENQNRGNPAENP